MVKGSVLQGLAGGYRSRVFLVLWVVSFVLTFAVSLVGTPIPYLVREFVGGVNAETSTMEVYGLVLSLGYVAITIGYFVGGFAADLLGKRRVVVVSFLMMAVGCGLYASALNMYFLFLAAFVLQFGFGLSSPAFSALVADYSSQGSTGMAYGVFNLSWIVAQIPAPLLGGAIAQFVNLRVSFAVGALICIVGMLVAFLMSGKNDEKKAVVKDKRSTVGLSSSSFTSYWKSVLVFCLADSVNGLLNGFMGPLLTGLLMFRMSASATQYGLVLSLAWGVVTAVVQIPGGKLADKFGRKPLALFSFLSSPLMFALGFSQSLLEFGLIMGGICAIGNLAAPALSAWLMDLIPADRRASMSGVTNASRGVGLIVGPTAGSYMWNLGGTSAVLPFGVLALISLSSLPFYLILKDTKNQKAKLETENA